MHMLYKEPCTVFVLNLNTLISFKIINVCLIIRITLLLGGIMIYNFHTCYNITPMLNLSASITEE